ncbi:MAG: SMP-30/gluconolactonase/LRE family protein, partial [Deltaproteobacteria bacterium]|nr:SMP-30/gluconolactonase/LRE family protein [Deltaproteobacteria bacterium]
MIKKILLALVVIIAAIVLYFIAWPVPIDPIAWEAPPNPGYTGPFAPNERLKGIEVFSIGDNKGPEDIALDSKGRIYAATHGGWIVRLQPDGSNPENWVQTGGRPLGIDFDRNGNLIVADAFIGLLSISPEGKLTILTAEADGIPILYADDVDVAADGKIYFSDASTKYGAKAIGDTYAASLLDLME